MPSPTTAAAGPIAAVKALLATSLANCYHFQRWTGTVWTVAQALERIYFDAMPPPPGTAAGYSLAEWQQMRPFALIYRSGPQAWQSNAEPRGYLPTGMLSVRFEENVPPSLDGDPGELVRRMDNRVGQIVTTGDMSQPGLLELTGTAGYLSILGVTLSAEEPERTAREEISQFGDAQWQFLHLEWGVRS